MRIIDVLNRDFVIADLKSNEKQGVLEEMVSDIASKINGIDREMLLDVLLEREKLGSTGIGYGVAIPHGKMKGINHIIVTFGKSTKGVDFQSLDGKPSHIFFLIIAPEDSTASHLKVLARISRLLKESVFRDKLMSASLRDDIYKIIVDEDRKV
ncbi:MAG: PTS fructose transporter subunit IIA [Deltaproteobacteria bacterium GWC2_42_11]|nr:MAG: PTS fructose transporter subunit IIA [Deltaproteobacteria bacterium GWC2_42_11]HBO83547.1 PTS fructose transporter subunit IIA [Deltaproteobacteria bacterium]